MKNGVKKYEMESLSGAGLYVGTYRKYNDCSLYGMWIDLNKFTNAEDFFEVCKQLHSDEKDTEFMFQDFQGFPRELYNESMGIDEVQKILDFLQLSEKDQAIVKAFCEVTGNNIEDFDDFVDKARDRCRGRWDSFEDFANAEADLEISCHSVDGVTNFFEQYFDYDAYARTLRCYHSVSEEGYIFADE